ncbi:MAG: TRAP transporter substrate-binding protein DctP [Spirochaetaceae bacterium]|jgi:TRAP-type C4-dicarboxylate transport system substrate-binding protein|nr:TRAP transporter substrate-binding protein DctP [Spirochaetaceae bacterium]
MKKTFLTIAAFCFLSGVFNPALTPLGAQQKTVTIKLASLAPESTPWGAALNKMAADWSAATGGAVKVIVYHNGVAGSEADVLRKLRLNQIQAAVFTSSGMNLISKNIITLSCPFLIRTDEELDTVLDRLRPKLEADVNRAGFVTIAWSKVGWIRFFSRRPVFVPSDMKSQKLAVGNDVPSLNDAFRTMGYQLVETNLNDVLVSLNSGAVDAIFQSPVNAAVSQAFGIAKNMSTLKIAPFMGAVILNQTAWRSIPERYRDELMQIGREVEKQNNQNVKKMEDDAVAAMLKNKLVINECGAAQQQEWIDDVNKVMPQLLNKTFDRTLYNDIQDVLRQIRK